MAAYARYRLLRDLDCSASTGRISANERHRLGLPYGPSMRSASATARTKPATLTTGHVIHVPEYIETGEVVKVDTRTGDFLQRA